MAEKERVAYFDNLKGFLITLVVIGHFIVPFTKDGNMELLREGIYAFHMPAFLILSGYFQKGRIQKYGGASSVSFGIAFMVQNAIMYILNIMTATGGEYGHNAADYRETLGIWGFWYMQALFFYGIITGMCKKKWTLMLIAFLMLLVLPYFNLVNAFNFSKMTSFYMFFFIGYAGLTDKVVEFLRNKYVRLLALIILGGAAYLFWMMRDFFNMSDLNLLKPYANYESLSIGIIYRVAYVVFAVLVSFCLISIMTNRKTILAKWGKNSLYVFVLHNYVMAFFYYYDEKYEYIEKVNSNAEYVIFVLLCIILTAVLASDWMKKVLRPVVEPYSYLDMNKLCATLKSYIKE